jgi:hypothetical protein
MNYFKLMGAIAERLDPEEVVDILGLGIEDLLDLDDIKMLIIANKERFVEFLDE